MPVAESTSATAAGTLHVVPTNLDGVFAIPAHPEGFDFSTATQQELMQQGVFFKKPDANADPRVHAIWQKAFAHKWPSTGRVIPHSEPMPGFHHLPRHAQQPEAGPATSYNWSGGVVQDGGGWTSAYGTWVVPAVSKPTTPAGTDGGWDSSSWVGMGGWIGSGEILQAGVAQTVDSHGNAHYYPWYEWIVPNYKTVAAQFPYVYMTKITNFTVAAGTEVYVGLSYGTRSVTQPNGTVVQQKYGQVTFANKTTNQQMSIVLNPPTGAICDGSSLDWIQERFTLGDGTLAAMPKYGTMTFSSAGGCKPNLAGNPTLGFLVNMLDNGGSAISSETDTTSSVSISYV